MIVDLNLSQREFAGKSWHGSTVGCWVTIENVHLQEANRCWKAHD